MLLKANELRHGNYYHFSGNSEGLLDYEKLGRVWINGDFKYYVEFKDISNEMLDNFTLSQIKLIPLTSELLIKCGFEREERGKESDFDGIEIVYFNNSVDIYDHGDGSFSYATYTRYPGRGFKAGRIIKYLHQLQNLYYSLTEIELEVQL